MTEYEKDGTTAYYLAPRCRCGSRNQKKVGYLTWCCLSCRHVYYYRVTREGLMPLARETALALDEEREGL